MQITAHGMFLTLTEVEDGNGVFFEAAVETEG
jgi:hypothetical protein